MTEEFELSSKIYHARKRKGLTQEQLAGEMEITPRWLQRIESGKQWPSGRLLYRLVRYLDIDLRGDEAT